MERLNRKSGSGDSRGYSRNKAILDHALAHPCHASTRVGQEQRLKGVQVSSRRASVNCRNQ
jgi:hypothetical protein